MSTSSISRMWINQPSTIQPLHSLHGTNVLAMTKGADCVIYYLSGDTISSVVSRECLSPGWINSANKS